MSAPHGFVVFIADDGEAGLRPRTCEEAEAELRALAECLESEERADPGSRP